MSRFEKLFRQKKIDVYYLFTIRNPSDIVASLYLASTIGPGSVCYTPSQLVEGLIKNKFDNPRLKIFMNGFLYYKLYKHICTITEVNKIKVLIYEKLKFITPSFTPAIYEIGPKIAPKTTIISHRPFIQNIE